MFFLGLIFAVLWGTAYFMGIRLDQEREQRSVLEERWRAEHGT